MARDRVVRVNSLLKEVLSDVIRKEVKNPAMDGQLVTVTQVDTTKDLRQAKVYISVIGDEKARKQVMSALDSAKGFIGVNSAKKVRLRFFPELSFVLDDGVDKHMRIDELISEIHAERDARPSTDPRPGSS